MPRRRQKEDHVIVAATQLAGVLVLLSLLSPKIRQTLINSDYLSLTLTVMGILGGLAIFVMLWKSLHAPDHRPMTLRANVYPTTDHRTVVGAVSEPYEQTTPLSPHEVLKQLHKIDWFQFEQLVGLLYRKLGYQVTRRGGANPDGGIDLLIEKDGVRTAIQCKHWKTWDVGVKAIREFLGALTDAQLQHGIFVTIGGYTGAAKALADKHGIEFRNAADLTRMLEETDAVLDPAVSQILNDQRKLCPKCESEMRLKTAHRGKGIGKQFWACSRYPRCYFTMPTG